MLNPLPALYDIVGRLTERDQARHQRTLDALLDVPGRQLFVRPLDDSETIHYIDVRSGMFGRNRSTYFFEFIEPQEAGAGLAAPKRESRGRLLFGRPYQAGTYIGTINSQRALQVEKLSENGVDVTRSAIVAEDGKFLFGGWHAGNPGVTLLSSEQQGCVPIAGPDSFLHGAPVRAAADYALLCYGSGKDKHLLLIDLRGRIVRREILGMRPEYGSAVGARLAYQGDELALFIRYAKPGNPAGAYSSVNMAHMLDVQKTRKRRTYNPTGPSSEKQLLA